ncbi:TonB-dependent receptor family protein [Novosphingobium album (ex Liu et al. 2023)]|uniref:TonB-dependent receptor n=1 Tax=Novosphingobium album (ex Liu et al. 2023) TaxID=3031130 RepID=A0ABT5WWG7_9SPHN|nr:TonB-dependent receptor [Novosphingobium album (ex Liu et al. 2023)]MDE8654212.1 TonB-dependent receptor [Novosphingobium album (ex Liu et al. 2023)]
MILPAPALAQTARIPATDEGVTIIVIGRLAANDAERRVQATPGGADVVTYEDYADKSLVSLRDTLAYSPGVYTQPRFGQEIRISIRGSGVSRGYHMRGLTLLQDGVPINLADDNGDFQELEPTFFDHLEVYRGANALRMGSGTLGGAINGVTPSGDRAHGLYARLDFGSFDMIRGLASFGFGDSDTNGWLAASADTQRGDRNHAKRHSLRLHGNAAFHIADGAQTRFYIGANSIDQQLPGALTQVKALTAPRTGNFVGNQARDIDSLRLQNRTTLELGSAMLNIGAFLNLKQLFHPIYQVIDQNSADRGVFARFDYVAGPFEMTLGGESRWGTIKAKRFLNVQGQRGALTFDARQTARTSTLYTELRFRPVPEVQLLVGAIYAEGYRRQEQSVPAPVVGSAAYDSFSPRVGLLWEPAHSIQVYANFSRSAEFPTFVELAQVAAFVPVREQHAWTAEIGTRGKRGWMSWDISLYRAQVRGEMLQFTVGPDIPAPTFNAGRTLHQGIEAGLSLEPTDWLRLRQIWQYSDFRFQDDAQFGNNRLPVVPRHVLRTEIRLGTEALHIAPNVEWVPEGAWADYANTVRVPGYALIGLTAGATLTNGIDVFLDARNLLGKKAIGDISAAIKALPTSEIYYPIEQRAVYAGIRARF